MYAYIYSQSLDELKILRDEFWKSRPDLEIFNILKLACLESIIN